MALDHQEQAVAEVLNLPAHVLIFPLPLQGHVNSMLKLAELLCLSGIHVTFLLSDHDHARLLRHANLGIRFSDYPGFRIATISDGLPHDHPRAGERVLDIMLSLKVVGESQFRDLMVSTDLFSSGGGRRRVTCFILDGVLSFAAKVGDEMGIPYVYFRTVSGCSFWANFCIPDIIDAGEVPLKAKDEDKMIYWNKKEMDLPVTSVPGTNGFLRRRDLPEFQRVENINDPRFVTISTETRGTIRAKALILNTFEDLEGPILSEIRKHVPTVYSIGPLHAHLKTRISQTDPTNHSASFWEEDRSCMSWLDSQPPKSVIYVSFGSVTTMTRNELLEFWHGLVNSGHRFLWIIRPDSIIGGAQVPEDLEEGTKARGYIVGWAPQEEVLSHEAIGMFLTHSGWNSTLESIVVGLPMLCWPNFADQTTNSRFVSEIWKIGVDMKDTCDRAIVEKGIRDLMEDRREEFLERTSHMAQLAKKAISEHGSSYHNLNGLIEFVKSSIASAIWN